MRFAALALAALLFLNCASVSAGYDPDNTSRIHVFHENNTFDHSTIYLLNGNARRRIIRCSGLSRCQYWIPEHQAEDILLKGYIELGWRLGSQDNWGDPTRPLHGRGQINVWNNMTVIIKIDPINTWIYPGAQPKQADE